MFTSVKSMEITNKGIIIATKGGKKKTLDADSIVPTAPLESNNSLLKGLEEVVSEVYAIGDCKEPRLIVDAIADGWRVGNAI